MTSFVIYLLFLSLIVAFVSSQPANLSTISITDYRVPSARNLCYNCLYQNDSAIFMTGTPDCKVVINGQRYNPPAFSEIRRNDCYNLGDYY